jgi:histidyl-tRNA synthetase
VLFNLIDNQNINSKYELDLTLARGLNYYTGAIFEVKAMDAQIGSVSGGGRYDDLTGIFGMPDVSGVGISFGADRIYDVLTELNLFPVKVKTSTKIMFVNFGEKEVNYCFSIASRLRINGIPTEIYPDSVKLKKQFAYADAKKIPFVIIAGESEIADNTVKIKDMNLGKETVIGKDKIESYF